MTAPTIFVIDDQKSVRHALGEMLSVFGFSVETYESGRQFPADARPAATPAASSPTCACRAWTASSSCASSPAARSDLPVVLISGHADVPMAVAAIKAGAEDFIEKPVDDTQLVAAINRGLRAHFDQQSRAQSLDATARRSSSA